jgi:predicted AlkP superfamily pyrophosphatase or phosphodiesterase
MSTIFVHEMKIWALESEPMRFSKTAALLVFVMAVHGAAQAPSAHKLIVVSVDGLDWRYLRDRDALHQRIPNMRRLRRDGRYATG